MNLFTKQKHTENELTVIRGKEWARIYWEFWINMYTLLYLKQTTNKNLLYSTRDSAQQLIWEKNLKKNVVPLCPTLCNPIECSTPDLPVLHHCSNSWPLSWWGHTTISSSVDPFSSYLQSLQAYQGLFQWVGSSLISGGQTIELQLQHQSLQWIFRTDFL